MSRNCVSWSLVVCVCTMGILARAEEKKPAQLELKAAKGEAFEFTVKQISANAGESSRGEFKSNDESEINYRIEVVEKKENGDLALKVTYASVKARQSGRDESWEFDSAKKEGGDEAASNLRKAISNPITVELKGGKLGQITGFPEPPPRPERGQGQGFNWRSLRAARIAGASSLKRDLEMILASPVQNQTLETGKEYRLASEAPEQGEQEGRGRGRWSGRDRPRLSYRFEGEGKGGAAAASFSLSTYRPEGREGGQEGRGPFGEVNETSKGSALVSMKDGLLVKLDLETESKSQGERDGNTFKFARTSKISAERKSAPAPAVKL